MPKASSLTQTANTRAVLKRGAAIGYDGAFLGYSLTDGRVVDFDGKTVGRSSSDGKVLNSDLEVVGEVIPENIVIDIWGAYKGGSIPGRRNRP